MSGTTRILSIVLALVVGLSLAPPVSAGVVLPDGGKIDQVDFERHVMGIFGRMGCNSGSCHGSFQGKGGFRLSLFGYDPAMDYAALSRDALGRRLNPVDPDNSLLLLKATGQTDHGGGRKFSVGSWQYQIFRDWITQGALWNRGSGEVVSIAITPKEHAFKKAGDTYQLMVKARFRDGSEENITPLCDFRTNNDAVAEVNNLGIVTALRPGDTAIVVSYRGNLVPVRAMVPNILQSGVKYPAVIPAVNYIDREVLAKLRRLNIIPSDLADDAEFLRRVYLDTIGSLPSPKEVRDFLADKAADKRARKIDELLAHPLHAALWATKFSDITGNKTDLLENPVQLQSRRSQIWHDWFRKRVADNMPYDEIVRGVLTATSRDGKTPEDWVAEAKELEEAIEKGWDNKYSERPSLDLFWRRQQNVPIEQWGEKTAAAFLGVRLECAQCHKHPMDRWTQADYRSYANIFSQVTFSGGSPETKKLIDEANKGKTGKGNNKQSGIIKELFVGPSKGSMTHPETNATLSPKSLGGPEIKIAAGKDARADLHDWLRSPDNPFFARSFVNRIWGHYFGVGIVHPVDDFSQANPPSNEKLLDALARDFIEHKFDLRYIEKTILSSRTYQLSAIPNPTNTLDKDNFSHSFVRPMMAEVVVDALNSALDVTETFGTDARPGSRAIEVGSTLPRAAGNLSVAHVLRIFGRPSRTSACDCDRALEPALPQTLYRMTDTSLLAKFNAPSGRLQKLIKAGLNDDQLLEELFLATLSRFPRDDEKQKFASYRARKSDRQAVFTDTLWALINTREFILNH